MRWLDSVLAAFQPRLSATCPEVGHLGAWQKVIGRWPGKGLDLPDYPYTLENLNAPQVRVHSGFLVMDRSPLEGKTTAEISKVLPSHAWHWALCVHPRMGRGGVVWESRLFLATVRSQELQGPQRDGLPEFLTSESSDVKPFWSLGFDEKMPLDKRGDFSPEHLELLVGRIAALWAARPRP